MTKSEKESINKYTSYYYESVNYNLRNGKSHPFVKHIDSAINRYKLNQEFMFHRGDEGGLIGNLSYDDIKSSIGCVISSKSYLSTSASRGYYEKYRYNIKTPKGEGIGAYIEGVSKFYAEREFLFGRNSKFKITNVRDEKKFILVDLEYVGKD